MPIANAQHAADGNRRIGSRWRLPVLLALVALVYWPGLHGGFVFDDYANIVDVTALHVTWNSSWLEWLAAVFSSPASDLQRPLAMLTFAINHAFTGIDPYWMKLTNLAIHLLNTWLVFGLCRCLLRIADQQQGAAQAPARQWVALWIAAAWALNPINLMAVLFVVQRMESLSHTFVFAGLWLYLLGRMRLQADGRGWTAILGGLVGGTALGLLAKESAVLLPVYAFLLEWALLGFSSHKANNPLSPTRGGEGIIQADQRLLATFGVVLLLPAVAGLAWMIPKVLGAGTYARRSFDLGERLLTEGRVLVDYLHWTLLPNLSQLSLYHDDYPISHGLLSPPATLWSLLLLAALLVAAWLLRKRRPLMALGLTWFFAAHLLTATIWPLELVYEHRNYFASLGLCLVLADLLLRAPQSRTLRRIGMATALGLLMLYAGLTSLRALEWSNPLRFALSEATKHPQSPRATYDLARDYIILSGYQADSPYVDRALAALEHARSVPGANPLPESAAITLAARTGRRIEPDWWRSLQHKLRTRPIGVQENNALSTLVTCAMEPDCPLSLPQMRASFNAALSQRHHPETLNIYGNYALNVLRDQALAMRLWQEAAHRAPGVLGYQENLARMFIFSGRFEQAKAPIARIRELGGLGQNEALARELEQLAQRPPKTTVLSGEDTSNDSRP